MKSLVGLGMIILMSSPAAFSQIEKLDVNQGLQVSAENAEQDIRWLQTNLHMMMKLIETEVPNELPLAAVEKYAENYKLDPELMRSIRSLYDLSYAIQGGKKGVLAKTDLDKLVTAKLSMDKEISRYVKRLFEDESPVTYKIHSYQRDQLKTAAIRMMSSLDQILNASGTEVRIVEVREVLKFLGLEISDDFLFLKKLLVGGDKDLLTHQELNRLSKAFPDLLAVALDGVRFKYVDLDQGSLIQLLKNDLHVLASVFRQQTGSVEKVLSLDEVTLLVKEITDENEVNADHIQEVKVALLGGNKSDITGKELAEAFAHAEKILRHGDYFKKFYQAFLVSLESKIGPLTINFEQNRDVFPEAQAELKTFIRIVRDYRYQKGEFKIPYYVKNQWHRNEDAIFDIFLTEYLLTELFKSEQDMTKLIQKHKKLLIDLEMMLPGEESVLADRLNLWGTFFQPQSSLQKEEVPKLDVNEATELVISTSSGAAISRELRNDLKETCPVDKFDRIEPSCFKENYFKLLCQNFKRQLPELMSDLGVTGGCEEINSKSEYLTSLLTKTISASRTCQVYPEGKEEIYYSEQDIALISQNLLQIEGMMARFDKNRNNKLGGSEVDESYVVIGRALDGFMATQPTMVKKMKRKIYDYVLTYNKVPDNSSIGGIAKFMSFAARAHKPEANRLGLMSLNAGLLEAAAKLRIDGGQKPFDCKLMADPHNIPRD